MEPSEWAQRDANLLHLPQVFCVSGNGPPVHQLLVTPPPLLWPTHNLHLLLQPQLEPFKSFR